jgi:hypothetical protein
MCGRVQLSRRAVFHFAWPLFLLQVKTQPCSRTKYKRKDKLSDRIERGCLVSPHELRGLRNRIDSGERQCTDEAQCNHPNVAGVIGATP